MNNRDYTEYDEQLLQLIKLFRQKVEEGTSDPETFLTISDIERLWSELRGNTSHLYSDMLTDILSNINETELIRKKKENIEKKE